MKNLVSITACTFLLTLGAHAADVKNYDGAVAVRLQENSSTCINANKHKVSLHLRRYLVENKKGLFYKDSAHGLLLETTIDSNDLVTNEAKTISYPKLFNIGYGDLKLDEGIVSLPVEQKIFHLFKLKSDDSLRSSVGLAFTYLKTKKKAPFGVVLEQLANVSKTIPASIDPFSASFKFFASYANGLVDQTLNSKNKIDKNVKSGQLVFSFSDDDTCTLDEERTGAIAVVSDYDSQGEDGIVDISRLSDYCLKAVLRPYFSVHYAEKQCALNPAEAEFREMNNPYTLYILNAGLAETEDGLAGDEEDEREALESEARARCNAYGIDTASC
ncbi:MAG: hypothetical protein AAF936_07515 [Pseudomonadota bacterium]